MRERLNANPIVQMALIGVLAVGVIFLLYTRVMSRDSGAEATPATDPTAAAAAAPATTDPAATPPATAPTTDPAADPAAAAPVVPATGVTDTVPAAASGEFVAGPGLPKDVVQAYDDGKVVTLLVIRERGIDDQKVRALVEALRSRGDTAVFVTPAATIARYSRITQGVDVDRVPALVVITPRKLTKGPTPTATVDYGFRGAQSVDQAVRDALYSGRQNLPYYPK